MNDGVNIRLMPAGKAPKNYQLMMELTDKMVIVLDGLTVYAGIREYFHRQRKESKQKLSAKAFLATEQRFPGIGNGVLQDILFEAGIHPKRKIESSVYYCPVCQPKE